MNVEKILELFESVAERESEWIIDDVIRRVMRRLERKVVNAILDDIIIEDFTSIPCRYDTYETVVREVRDRMSTFDGYLLAIPKQMITLAVVYPILHGGKVPADPYRMYIALLSRRGIDDWCRVFGVSDIEMVIKTVATALFDMFTDMKNMDFAYIVVDSLECGDIVRAIRSGMTVTTLYEASMFYDIDKNIDTEKIVDIVRRVLKRVI